MSYGTSTERTDYGKPGGECCFEADSQAAVCVVDLVVDEVVEPDETFLVRLHPEEGQFICEDNTTLEVTVSDAEREEICVH